MKREARAAHGPPDCYSDGRISLVGEYASDSLRFVHLNLWRAGAVLAMMAQISGHAAAAAAAPNTTHPKGESAHVEIWSSGSRVTIAQITQRSNGLGFGGYPGGFIQLRGETWRDLCISPCDVDLEPGLYEFKVYGSGVTETFEKFELEPGDHYLRVDPGSSAMWWTGGFLAGFGIAAILVGATTYAVTPTLDGNDETTLELNQERADARSVAGWLVLGGALATGTGFALVYGSHTSIERWGGDQRGPADDETRLLLRYSGSM